MAKSEKDVIKFLKLRDVLSPQRAFKFDAGIDFFVPKFNKEFVNALKEKNPKLFSLTTPAITAVPGSNVYFTTTTVTANENIIKFDEDKCLPYFILPAHGRVKIPSGIYSRMSGPGRALIAANKSGVATEHGLVFSCQVVDFTYKGEIHIGVINTSNENIRIYQDMKLIQFVETPIFYNEIEISEGGNFYEGFWDGIIDDRKDGGFGSTNKDVKQINS